MPEISRVKTQTYASGAVDVIFEMDDGSTQTFGMGAPKDGKPWTEDEARAFTASAATEVAALGGVSQIQDASAAVVTAVTDTTGKLLATKPTPTQEEPAQ